MLRHSTPGPMGWWIMAAGSSHDAWNASNVPAGALHVGVPGSCGSPEPVGLVYAGLRALDDGSRHPRALPRCSEERLHAGRLEEQRRGSTLVGPHRDDLQFLLRGMNAQEFASQGEHKSLLIALKLAELLYVQHRAE